MKNEPFKPFVVQEAREADALAECRRLRDASAMAHRTPDHRAIEAAAGFRHLLLTGAQSGAPVATVAFRPVNPAAPVSEPCPLDGEFDIARLVPSGHACLEVDGPCARAGISVASVLTAVLGWLDRAEPVTTGIAVRLRLPLTGGDRYVQSLVKVLQQLRGGYRSLARPRVPLPRCDRLVADDLVLPSRLHAWLKAGAMMVSPPAWDAEAGNAVLLLWRPATAGMPTRAGVNSALFQPRQPFAQAGDLVQ